MLGLAVGFSKSLICVVCWGLSEVGIKLLCVLQEVEAGGQLVSRDEGIGVKHITPRETGEIA